MAFLSTHGSGNNQNLYSGAVTLIENVYSELNPSCMSVSIKLSDCDTGESTYSISIYLDEVLLNGQPFIKIKPSGITSFMMQLDTILVMESVELKITIQSDNSSDTVVDYVIDILDTLQSNVAAVNGFDPDILVDIVQTVTDQTHLILSSSSDTNDVYNNHMVLLYDIDGGIQCLRRVSDYVGSTKTIVLDKAPDFTIVANDYVRVLPTRSEETYYRVYYVSGTTGDDANDGFTWASAKKTINAISSTGSTRKIIVAAGTYTEFVDIAADNEVHLLAGAIISYNEYMVVYMSGRSRLTGRGKVLFTGALVPTPMYAVSISGDNALVGSGIRIESTDSGIYFDGNYVNIESCSIVVGRRGIHAKGNGFIIDRPIIQLNLADYDLTGVYVEGQGILDLPAVNVSGSGANYSATGLYISSNSTCTIKNIGGQIYSATNGTGEIIGIHSLGYRVTVENYYMMPMTLYLKKAIGVKVTSGSTTIISGVVNSWENSGADYRCDLQQSSTGVLAVSPAVYYNSDYIEGTIDRLNDNFDAAAIALLEDAAETGAQAAINESFEFVGSRVKALSQSTNGGIGAAEDDGFIFSLSKTKAEDYIVTEGGSVDVEHNYEYDGDRQIKTYYGNPTVGTQWQISVTIVQDDPSGYNPPIVFSSSDELVATVDDGGFVHYVGNGTCRIVAESIATDDGLPYRTEIEITNSSTTPDSTVVTEYVPDAFDAAKHMLIVYNDDTESEDLLEEYITHRPGVSTANTLQIDVQLPTGRTISESDTITKILDPIEAWFNSNPTKINTIRYIVLIHIPTRVINSSISVCWRISTLLKDSSLRTGAEYHRYSNYSVPIAPYSVLQYPGSVLVTSLDMASYDATSAYISKLADMAAVEGALQADGVTISALAGGYDPDKWVFDGKCSTTYQHPGFIPMTNTWSGYRTKTVDEGVLDTDCYPYPRPTPEEYSGSRVATASDITFWLSWGKHTPLLGDWPVSQVTLSGKSKWFLMSSIESFNGIYFHTTHGDPSDFFNANAWGGSNYEFGPIYHVGHTQEPGWIAVNYLYPVLWYRGYYAIDAAWKSIGSRTVVCIGDPLVKR